MFYETSHEKLFFTENWPTSTTTLKGNFSKSLNSLYSKKMKSYPTLSNSTNSFSGSRSRSLSSIADEE